MDDWLYDINGEARMFRHFDRFISRKGKNVGWLNNEDVHSLNGTHIGWFEKGVLYDRENRPIAFTVNAEAPPAATREPPPVPQIPDEPDEPTFYDILPRPEGGPWSGKDLGEMFGLSF